MNGVRGHDPLCPIARETWCVWTGDKCEHCALIARVREDERGRPLMTAWDNDEYQQGQRDERERIRTGVTGLPSVGWDELVRDDVLAVIDGGAVIDAGSLPEGYKPTRTVTSPFAGGPL